MDALLMCGGRGTRLESDREKPLYPVDGTPMIDRVRAALADSRVETTYAVVSPHAPDTHEHVRRSAQPIVETPGEGYVADLRLALERVSPPVLTVAADLPLLDGDAIDRVSDGHDGRATTVCVPVALKRRLGASVDATLPERDHLAPTGVNVVGARHAPSMRHTSYDPRLAINVNRLEDAALAEALCE